ncbi:MAG: ABC transporter permease [Candidatus Riflebacteria bacterium]|nr:ABC transporter permease [Candidatus Riflebacteria bacterium]
MSFSNIKFFIVEALTNLRRAGVMAFITISTIAIALVLMGTFLLATMNMEGFLSQMQSEALVTAYLKKSVDIDTANTLSLRLSALEEVEKIQVVSPDDAAKELFSDPNEQQLLQIGITNDENPLPTTLRIKIKSGATLNSLLEKLKNEPLIDTFSYGEELFKQFEGLSRLLWIFSLAIVILLGLASLFIVYNTVRLTLFMRREEIIIMKLVGATNWFVRGPFIVEGFMEGVFASTIAILFLSVSYNFILTKFAELIPFFTPDVGIDQLVKLAIKLFMMGVVLGVSGSLISLRDINKFSRSTALYEGI